MRLCLLLLLLLALLQAEVEGRWARRWRQEKQSCPEECNCYGTNRCLSCLYGFCMEGSTCVWYCRAGSDCRGGFCVVR